MVDKEQGSRVRDQGAEVRAEHTPGPWEIDQDDPLSITQIEWGGIGRACDNAMVFNESRRAYRAQREIDEANARLMAAAPQLLEACKAALEVLKEVSPPLTVHGMLDYAIAAAEGKQ